METGERKIAENYWIVTLLPAWEDPLKLCNSRKSSHLELIWKCVWAHVGSLRPKKSSGDKRDEHWINSWEVLNLPSSMAFQDGIAAADIHDISGHRKFIREKKMQLLCTHLETSEISHVWRTTAKQLLIFMKLGFPSFPV